jgi:hypothetical protein
MWLIEDYRYLLSADDIYIYRAINAPKNYKLLQYTRNIT